MTYFLIPGPDLYLVCNNCIVKDVNYIIKLIRKPIWLGTLTMQSFDYLSNDAIAHKVLSSIIVQYTILAIWHFCLCFHLTNYTYVEPRGSTLTENEGQSPLYWRIKGFPLPPTHLSFATTWLFLDGEFVHLTILQVNLS